MGKKVTFSHDISEEIKEAFDRLADMLGGNKYEKVEAALAMFMALPDDLQDRLLSGRPENRKMVLELLAALQIPAVTSQRGQRSRTPKSGG